MSETTYCVRREVKYGPDDWRKDEALRTGLEREEAQSLCRLLNEENASATKIYAVGKDSIWRTANETDKRLAEDGGL